MAVPERQTESGYAPPETKSTNDGRVYVIIGFVCAAVALVFLPIVFGPAAIVLGYVGKKKGDELGKWAMIAGAVGLVVGMIVGAIVFSAASDSQALLRLV